MANWEEKNCVSTPFSNVGPGAVEIKFASTPRPHNSRPLAERLRFYVRVGVS